MVAPIGLIFYSGDLLPEFNSDLLVCGRDKSELLHFRLTGVFRLWGIVIVLAIIFTIVATILTHIVSAIIEAIKTGSDDPEIEDFEDERDRLIDLRGTKVTYTISSIGVFLAMLTFVFGQPPLVMFTLLIFFGVVAQIIGDISRLILYRRGF